jgi:hypothetical protein
MRSKQRQAESLSTSVPPVPTTLWYQLSPSSQQQLAHLVAQLLQRVRQAAKNKESEHEH